MTPRHDSTSVINQSSGEPSLGRSGRRRKAGGGRREATGDRGGGNGVEEQVSRTWWMTVTVSEEAG
jgi:hypothetical protein